MPVFFKIKLAALPQHHCSRNIPVNGYALFCRWQDKESSYNTQIVLKNRKLVKRQQKMYTALNHALREELNLRYNPLILGKNQGV
jgi:hypothetical protein